MVQREQTAELDERQVGGLVAQIRLQSTAVIPETHSLCFPYLNTVHFDIHDGFRLPILC